MHFNNNNSIGLYNIGNSCYFNSILQLLYQCTVINKLLIYNNISGSIIDIYKDFIITYASSTNAISPNNIINNILIKFNNIQQQFNQEDADQYLQYIIDNLIDELNKFIKEKQLENCIINNRNLSLSTLINNLFTLKLIKNITCPLCNYTSKTDEYIYILYLCINNKKSMNNLIYDYLNDTLDGKFKCEHCDRYVSVSITREIVNSPKYLIITLTRYNNTNQKIQYDIDMYHEFKLNKQYELRGVIYHAGNTSGGHYIYVGKKNNEWYMYNDANISTINEETLNNIIKRGYIYLYVTK